MGKFFTDVTSAVKSKRVITAVITAFFVATAEELGVSQDTAMTVAGICIALIVGDSLRPVSPDAEKYARLASEVNDDQEN